MPLRRHFVALDYLNQEIIFCVSDQNKMASTSGAVITRVLPTPDGGIRVPTELGLSLVSRKLLYWNEEDVIMDIGCRYGTYCLHCKIPYQTKLKKYFVIDIDPVLIQLSRNVYSQGIVEFYVGGIEFPSTFREEWFGKITKLICLNALHCLTTYRDQTPAFQNVFNLLAPGGEAILLFAIRHPFWEVDFELLKMEKWAYYYEFLSHMRWSWTTGLYEYRKTLGQVGFEVLSHEYNYLETVYTQISELCDNYGKYCGLFFPAVPDAIREELMKDRFTLVTKYLIANQNGEITLNFTTLGLHLRKPF